jgi:integrase
VRGDISEEHYRRQIDALENDVFPFIGQKFVDDVGAPDIIAVIRRMMERDVKDSARKVFYAINRTYKWAVSNLLAQRNPAADIDLKELIGERNENHYPTITDDDGVMLLLQAIEDDTGAFTTKQALRFMPYVFVRPTNIRHAEWGEFNFKTKQWVIPGHKMKTKQELIVPLTDSAIAILEETREMTAGSRYVFPSLRTRTEPMSDAALLNAVRRMGYSKEQFVPHGFRAMFSTIAHERSPFSHEAIETQLAHSVGSSVSKAYNRAKYLKERVQLMQWWSDHLDALKARR